MDGSPFFSPVSTWLALYHGSLLQFLQKWPVRAAWMCRFRDNDILKAMNHIRVTLLVADTENRLTSITKKENLPHQTQSCFDGSHP
ncbi:uncharacterized [Tachysurus ichikawai]